MVRRSLADPPGVRVTVCEPRDVLGPEGETTTERLTVLLNPYRLVRVRVTTPDALRGILIDDVLLAREKSGAVLTWTRTVVECDWDPEFPVIVTV